MCCPCLRAAPLGMCWSFNGLEPGGSESERKRLISPGLLGKPIEPCSWGSLEWVKAQCAFWRGS